VITLIAIDRVGVLTPDLITALTASGCAVQASGNLDEARRLSRPDRAEVLLLAVSRGDPPDLLAGLPELGPEPPYILVTPSAAEAPLLARGAYWTLAPPLDAALLLAVVRLAAESCGLRRDLLRQRHTLSTFNDVGRALTSTLKLKEVLNLIAEKTTELVKCEAWSLLLMDPKTNELTFEIATGPQPELVRGFRIQVGQGIAGWVAKEGQPILVQDAQRDPRFYPAVDGTTGLRTRSILCVPLMSKERTLGVIELINKIDRSGFDRHDLELVTTLAGYGAIAIENARLYEKAEELAITDDTTQIPNMRYFHHILNREVVRARRRNSLLALLFIDLDKFKLVNDTHGHLHGSRLLQEVAHLLRRSLRGVDLVARYGGDEFVALLPDTAHDMALRLAERLRAQVEAFGYRPEPGLTIGVTCSIGVASFPDQAKTQEDLIRFADQAMYRGKGASRNVVYSALQDRLDQPVRPT
jgi:diguanylate cyclase (GGDEF)-like protein